MPCCKKRAARKSAECFNHVFDYVSSAGSWRMPALHRCLSVLVLIYPCMHVLPCTQVVHHTHCPAALYLRVSCSTRPPAAAVVQPRPSLLPRRPPRRPRSPSQSQRTRTRPQVVTTVTRTRRMSKRRLVTGCLLAVVGQQRRHASVVLLQQLHRACHCWPSSTWPWQQRLLFLLWL